MEKTRVWLSKYRLRTTKKNGQRNYRYQLRWLDPATGKWCSESTGTADKVQAQYWQQQKFEELNGMREAPAPSKPVATWEDCRDAIEKAMRADDLRPNSVSNAKQTLETLRQYYPDARGPADITAAMAQAFKEKRKEEKLSSWTIKGDLSQLRAIYRKWLGKVCGLVDANPFADVAAPRCDAPEVRIVSTLESQALFDWLARRWGGWELPQVYLRVAAYTGWRASEVASLKSDDLVGDDVVICRAENSKTRRQKTDALEASLFADLRSCSAGGWAFGKFAAELPRRLRSKGQAHHAARVQDFSPGRLVHWMQAELERYNDRQAKADEGWDRFTLHDFRRTAITGMQEAGGTEKQVSQLVGATPEVIRAHYERMDQVLNARRLRELRLRAGGAAIVSIGSTACAHAANA